MCHCCAEARQAASCNQSLLLQLGGSATVDQHLAFTVAVTVDPLTCGTVRLPGTHENLQHSCSGCKHSSASLDRPWEKGGSEDQSFYLMSF